MSEYWTGVEGYGVGGGTVVEFKYIFISRTEKTIFSLLHHVDLKNVKYDQKKKRHHIHVIQRNSWLSVCADKTYVMKKVT